MLLPGVILLNSWKNEILNYRNQMKIPFWLSQIMSWPLSSEIQAYCDGVYSNILKGWVWNPRRPDETIDVEVFVGGFKMLTRSADAYRPDLKAVGIGSGRYGYEIDLVYIAELARRAGTHIELRAAGRYRQRLGTVYAASDRGTLDIYRNLSKRSNIYRQPPQALFKSRSVAEATSGGSARLMLLSPYTDYVRLQHGFEISVASDKVSEDIDNVLKWYIETYGVIRRPLRVPLSAAEISYLTAPIFVQALGRDVSRVMALFSKNDDYARALLSNFDEEDAFRDLVYWWAAERAQSLNVEDCLVTGEQIAFLRSVVDYAIGEPFPRCHFLNAIVSKRQDIARVGSIEKSDGRKALYLTIAREALVNGGGNLRFFPDVVLGVLFDPNGLTFDQAGIKGSKARAPFEAAAYQSLLDISGFNLESLQFKTIDQEGNRIDTSSLTAPAAVRNATVVRPCVKRCDIQVIGPFSKTSGIGQTTRMSRSILQKTTFNCNFVDFTMDNVQPEYPTDDSITQQVTDVRVNIIHLNADQLPLAYAYLPNVFDSAYTIGFFFWELDKPSPCHQLALNLVDEIWVSTEYNRVCFASATTKPVVNIGTALPEMVQPGRAEAREKLERAFNFTSEDFVFFSAYDTFSYPQRKNPLGLVRAFQDAFPIDPFAKLILKTFNATVHADSYRLNVFKTLKAVAANDPRVIIIDSVWDYSKYITFKKGSDCYVSLHRSEGLGIGMLEAMNLGIPVVCTGYSGNMDFCSTETAWLVDYGLTLVEKDEYANVTTGSVWAAPDHLSAVAQIRAVRSDRKRREQRIASALATVHERYSLSAATSRYESRLTKIGLSLKDKALR